MLPFDFFVSQIRIACIHTCLILSPINCSSDYVSKLGGRNIKARGWGKTFSFPFPSFVRFFFALTAIAASFLLEIASNFLLHGLRIGTEIFSCV